LQQSYPDKTKERKKGRVEDSGEKEEGRGRPRKGEVLKRIYSAGGELTVKDTQKPRRKNTPTV